MLITFDQFIANYMSDLNFELRVCSFQTSPQFKDSKMAGVKRRTLVTEGNLC